MAARAKNGSVVARTVGGRGSLVSGMVSMVALSGVVTQGPGGRPSADGLGTSSVGAYWSGRSAARHIGDKPMSRPRARSSAGWVHPDGSIGIVRSIPTGPKRALIHRPAVVRSGLGGPAHARRPADLD